MPSSHVIVILSVLFTTTLESANACCAFAYFDIAVKTLVGEFGSKSIWYVVVLALHRSDLLASFNSSIPLKSIVFPVAVSVNLTPFPLFKSDG